MGLKSFEVSASSCLETCISFSFKCQLVKWGGQIHSEFGWHFGEAQTTLEWGKWVVQKLIWHDQLFSSSCCFDVPTIMNHSLKLLVEIMLSTLMQTLALYQNSWSQQQKWNQDSMQESQTIDTICHPYNKILNSFFEQSDLYYCMKHKPSVLTLLIIFSG